MQKEYEETRIAILVKDFSLYHIHANISASRKQTEVRETYALIIILLATRSVTTNAANIPVAVQNDKSIGT
jgi:hypothetical protein